jgi:hypothetical protein
VIVIILVFSRRFTTLLLGLGTCFEICIVEGPSLRFAGAIEEFGADFRFVYAYGVVGGHVSCVSWIAVFCLVGKMPVVNRFVVLCLAEDDCSGVTVSYDCDRC